MNLVTHLIAVMLLVSLKTTILTAEESEKPVEDAAKPVEDSAKPVEEPAKPAKELAKPPEEPVKPAEELAKPAEELAKPPEELAKPAEELAKPPEEPVKPAEELAKPPEETVKPPEEPAKPVEEQAKPGVEPAKPGEEPAKPGVEPAEPGSELSKKPTKPSDGQTLYKIQNEKSGEFLYIDTETRGSTSADVFTGPIKQIEKSPKRFMTFKLTPVGDAYQITCPDADLTLVMAPPSPRRGLLSVAIKAEVRDEPDDLGLWYLAISPIVATRIVNKKSSYFLYAYRFGWHWKRHTVVASPSKGVTFIGSSLWVIKEASL